MKHTPSPISSQRYYYLKWKHHCFLFLLALVGIIAAVPWAVAAGLYGSTFWLIVAILVGVFALFSAVVEYRACDESHTRYLRAMVNPSPINSNNVTE